jgi:hypothetical protein
MSAMEPDEGAQPDDQQADAPREETAEAAGVSDAPRWPEADTDAESSDTDGSDADDVSSTDA